MKHFLLSGAVLFFCTALTAQQLHFRNRVDGASVANRMTSVSYSPYTKLVAGTVRINLGAAAADERSVFVTFDTIQGTVHTSRLMDGIRTELTATEPLGNGYLLAGYKMVNSVNISGIVIKVDTSGAVQWARELPGTQRHVMDMDRRTDGTYIVCGDEDNTQYSYLAALDSNGTVLWQKHFQQAGSSYNGYTHIAASHDNGAVAVGWSDSGSGGSAALKTSSNGTVAWAKTYVTSGGSSALGITQTHDHGFAICGVLGPDASLPNDTGITTLYILKTDSAGNPQWAKYYPFQWQKGAAKICENGAHELVVSGSTSQPAHPQQAFVLNTSFTGTPLHLRFFRPYYYMTFENMCTYGKDQTYFCGGATDYNSSTQDYFFVKHDRWSTLGCGDSVGYVTDYPFSFAVNTTYTQATATGSNLVTVTDSAYSYVPINCVFNGIPENESALLNCTVYPQPSNGAVFISWENPLEQNALLTLFDLNGKKIRSISLNTFSTQCELQRGDLNTGMYFFRVETREGVLLHAGKVCFGG